jgi:hypothetical protein
MSVTGVSLPPAGAGSPVPPVQSLRQEKDNGVHQLMQDLSSGNASAAEQDYTTLSSLGSNGLFSNAKLNSEFQTVGQDIQGGNLSGALSTMQTLGSQQIQYDQAVAQQANASGNIAAYQQAMANLQGDNWAVYGNPGSEPPVQGGSPVSVNA